MPRWVDVRTLNADDQVVRRGRCGIDERGTILVEGRLDFLEEIAEGIPLIEPDGKRLVKPADGEIFWRTLPTYFCGSRVWLSDTYEE